MNIFWEEKKILQTDTADVQETLISSHGDKQCSSSSLSLAV